MRISVFFDYQNVYHSARRAFHNQDAPPSFGQISPLSLAELICDLRMPDTDADGYVLEEVRVYRGMPRLTDVGHASAHRQIAQWRAQGITVLTRPLSGSPGAPREKGIDVALALDFYAGIVDGSFDIGILMTMDRDFEPLLEKVRDVRPGLPVPIETAVWWAPPRQQTILRASGDIACHRLREREYDLVRDLANYRIPARSRKRRRRNRGR